MSALAHQLRTPLAVVTGYAELLVHRDDEQTRREAPERILAAADRLADAVDDLLVVFALDAGWLDVQSSPTDLGPPIEDAFRTAASRHPDHAFVTLENAGSWPVVLADAEQVTRVVRAFVSTLCGAARERGSVSVSVASEGDYARVEVAHTAAHLDDAKQAKLFDGIDPTGSAPLEPYKARKLVEAQGGAVAAGVSSVSFTLPLVPSGAS